MGSQQSGLHLPGSTSMQYPEYPQPGAVLNTLPVETLNNQHQLSSMYDQLAYGECTTGLPVTGPLRTFLVSTGYVAPTEVEKRDKPADHRRSSERVQRRNEEASLGRSLTWTSKSAPASAASQSQPSAAAARTVPAGAGAIKQEAGDMGLYAPSSQSSLMRYKPPSDPRLALRALQAAASSSRQHASGSEPCLTAKAARASGPRTRARRSSRSASQRSQPEPQLDSHPTKASHPGPSHDGTSEDLLAVVAGATDIMAHAKAAASRKRQGKQQVDQPMSMAEFELLPTSSRGPTGKRIRSGTASDVPAAPAPAASSAQGRQASSSQQPLEAAGRRRSSISASRHSAPAASGRAGGYQPFIRSTPAQPSYISTASDEQLGSMQQYRSSFIPSTQPMQLNIHLMSAASVEQVRMPNPVYPGAATASAPTGSIPLIANYAQRTMQAAQPKQAAPDSSRQAAEMAPPASHPDLLSAQQSYNSRASSATTNCSFQHQAAGFQRATPTYLAAASSLPADINISQQVFQQQQASYGQASAGMGPPEMQPADQPSAAGSPGYTYKLQYQQMYMQQYQQQLQIKHEQEQALGDAEMQQYRQQEAMQAHHAAHHAGISVQQEQEQQQHEEAHVQQTVQAQDSMQQQMEMMPKEGYSSTVHPEDPVEDLRQGVDCPLKMPGEILVDRCMSAQVSDVLSG